MSDDTDDAIEDEPQQKTQVLDADAVAELAQQERRATKSIAFETDAGVAEYEYQMIREGRVAELSEKHFETPEVRGRQQANDLDMDADDYERFRAEVIAESVVGAPEGTKPTRQWIRQNVPDRWQSELFEAITEFASMSDEEVIRFR